MDLAAAPVAHAGAAPALEQECLRRRVGADIEVLPRTHGVQIAARRAHAPPAGNRRLRHRDAVLRGAVVIGVVGEADLLPRAYDRVVERAAFRGVGDLQRAVPPPELVLAAGIALHPAEHRQHVAVGPAAIAELRPAVEILRLAAHEHHAVDRGGPAQQPPARHGNAPPARALLGLRGIEPVGGGVVDQPGEADGDGRPGVARPARLQQQHARGRVRRKPVGQHRAGRARPHDDIVETLFRHAAFPPQFNPTACRSGRGASDEPPIVTPDGAKRKSGVQHRPRYPARPRQPRPRLAAGATSGVTNWGRRGRDAWRERRAALC